MENILADPAKHVVVQNPRNSGFYFDWCYLDDTSPARRYTEILDNGSEDPSKYIPFYEEFRNDINNHSLNNKEIGNTYGCCERKMLAFSGYQDVSEIYSRWLPAGDAVRRFWIHSPVIIMLLNRLQLRIKFLLN